jgi:alpha-tubulin suppressor-like RCC1 family protein
MFNSTNKFTRKAGFSIGFAACFLLLSGQLQAQSTRYRQTNAYASTTLAGIAGYDHTLEIRAGQLWAYGDNTYGQLGNGTTTNASTPVLAGTANNWVTAAGGQGFTVAIQANGTLWSWGKNDHGQLGLGDDTQQLEPQQIGTDQNWIAVTAGNHHVMAIKSNGTLWSWGWNQAGELGNGDETEQQTPVQVGTDNHWASIAAGFNCSAAIQTNGTLWTWGTNTYGQLGDGTTDAHNIPAQVGTDHDWIKVDLGQSAAIALKTGGDLWVWGQNTYGNFGNGTTTDSNTPIQTGAAFHWKKVNLGQTHVTAIRTDGTLWTWGENTHGQLGNGENAAATNATMIQVGTANDWADLYTGNGYAQSFAVKANGSTWAFGDNANGQLGTGDLIAQLEPVATTNNTDWMDFQMGANNTSYIRGGRAWGTGANSSFQLGNGHVNPPITPVYNPLLNPQVNNIISYSTGFATTYAVRADGTLWGWGQNNNFQLADGSTTLRRIPVQIGAGSEWTAVYAGYGFALALKNDGTLWGWGTNSTAQLGINSTVNQPAIVQIGTDTDWASVSPGSSHVVAIKTDGTLWAWGSNSNGQIGNGTTTLQAEPVQIGTDNDWIAASTGSANTIAIKSNGTLWVWGQGSSGQQGNGGTSDNLTPTQLGTDTDWTFANGGTFGSSCTAIRSNGTLYTWGGNLFGQLGLGVNNFQQLTPVLINNIQNAVAADGGNFHIAILKADRSSVCMAGQNSLGQLATGNSSNSNVFMCGLYNSANLVEVESIDVTVLAAAAPEITVNQGTLQMAAAILPSNANQGVLWTIVPETGAAAISNTGLITAASNGTVWAKATSVENAQLQDSVLITLTNQLFEVDSLDVTTLNNVAATITINEGTLQLVATVMQAEATQEVTWSIIPVTGTATISATGLVSALTDGTVWAKAVSVENALALDSIEITISGQWLPVTAINVTTQGNVSPIILVDNGTLQMVATLTPVNSNPGVNWTLLPGTGSATISTTGLVTAQTNGTVWAKAVAAENAAITDSMEITILNQSNVGLAENDLSNGIQCYPNPVTGNLYISCYTHPTDLTTITWMDISGKIIGMLTVAPDAWAQPVAIDLSGLAPGMYHLQLEGAAFSQHQTIVKN